MSSQGAANEESRDGRNPYEPPAIRERLPRANRSAFAVSVLAVFANGAFGLLFIDFWIVQFFPSGRPHGNAPVWLWILTLTTLGVLIAVEIYSLTYSHRRIVVTVRLLHMTLALLWIVGIAFGLSRDPDRWIAIEFSVLWIVIGVLSFVFLFRRKTESTDGNNLSL